MQLLDSRFEQGVPLEKHKQMPTSIIQHCYETSVQYSKKRTFKN